MTHIAQPTSRTRRHHESAARRAMRRWVRRHLVAMDPEPAAGSLDALDAQRRAAEAGTTVWTHSVPSH